MSDSSSRPGWLSPTISPTVERLLMAVIFAWIAYRTWWLVQIAWGFNTDDAYITLRYSRHLAEGKGLVWNPGEDPVEGYSNFTYVLIGAMALKAQFDPLIAFKFIGAGALIGNLVLAWIIARHWVGPFLATMAPVLMSAQVGNVWWSVSGLETETYQFLLLAVMLALMRGLGYRWVDRDLDDGLVTKRELSYQGNWLGGAGILAAIAGMTRPEGPLIFGLAWVAMVIDAGLRWREGEFEGIERPLRALVAFSLPFIILYGGYFVIRWVYYGRLLPNTVYCKSNYRGASPWKLHLSYWRECAPHLLFALLVPWRRLDARHVVIWGVPICYGLLMYRVDPIISRFHRHFMATHAFVCIGVAIALGHIGHMLFGRAWKRYRAMLLICGLLYMQGHLKRRVVAPMTKLISMYQARMANREDLGMWLDARMGPEETFVIGDAGMVPYLARAKVIDAYCLNSSVMTGPKIRKSRKRWVDWVLRQGPERIVVHSSEGNRLSPRPEYNFYPALVEDGRFKADYEEEKRFPDERYAYFVFKRRADAEPADRPDPDAKDDKKELPDPPVAELDAENSEESSGGESEETTGGFVPAVTTKKTRVSAEKAAVPTAPAAAPVKVVPTKLAKPATEKREPPKPE